MLTEKPTVYVYVRPPKTGGTSLTRMLLDSRPGAKLYGLPASYDPKHPPPLTQRLRKARSRFRMLTRYRTISMARAWEYIDAHARNGDLIGGHRRFGEPALPNLNMKYFTLLRNPLDRALSEYNYSRVGFRKRNFIHRPFVRGRLKAAGKYSFSGYLSYLDEHLAGDASVMASFVFGGEQPTNPLEFLQTHYFHFGVLEQFDRFCDELGEKLGVTLKMRRDNVTPLREATSLKVEDRSVFERVFGRDMELYEAVLAHLQVTGQPPVGCSTANDSRFWNRGLVA